MFLALEPPPWANVLFPPPFPSHLRQISLIIVPQLILSLLMFVLQIMLTLSLFRLAINTKMFGSWLVILSTSCFKTGTS